MADTTATCCKLVSSGWGYISHPCGRPSKVEVNGKHYCGIHDPIKKQAQREEKNRQWDAERKEQAKKNRLERAAPDLYKELEHLVALLSPLEASGGLNVPGLATLNGARKALKSAVSG